MLDTLCMIIVVLLLTAWHSSRTFNYWKDRNVVCKQPIPFFGTSSLFRKRKRLHPSLEATRLYNEYPQEKCIGGFISSRPYLMLRDPELIQQVLIKDFTCFVDRGIAIDIKREPLSQHLFILNGDAWRTLRHTMLPTYSSAKMKKMFPLMVECGEALQHCIENAVERGETADTKDLVEKYTTDIIGSCAFGIKMNSSLEETFRKMGSKIFEPSKSRFLKKIIRNVFPKLYYLLGLKVFDKEAESFFLNIVHTIIESRDNQPSMRDDFIDMLIELKTKGFIENVSNKSGEKIGNIEITKNLLSAQAFEFFTAGFEISSSTMCFALHELAFNQDVQTKVTYEIETVLANYNGQITYEAVQEMSYLQMVIDETLRMYPPSLLMRHSLGPYRFPGTDVRIDKGIPVIIPVHALHHDPNYFPDPEKFIPERFDKKKKIQPCVYLPFGDGPRTCIGIRFAKLQIKVGLIYVLRDIHVISRDTAKREIKLSPNTSVLRIEDGLNLDLTHRRSY